MKVQSHQSIGKDCNWAKGFFSDFSALDVGIQCAHIQRAYTCPHPPKAPKFKWDDTRI